MLAIIGGILTAFVLRVANMIVAWLARILHVESPEPIPAVDDKRHQEGS